MNVMRRKIISLNLAIIIVLSLLPFGITPAKAADDIGYATFFKTKTIAQEQKYSTIIFGEQLQSENL